MLARGDEVSFVSFIYDDIEWSESSNIGFRNADGSQIFMVPGALTPSAIDIEETSNVGVEGLYLYRVDGDTIVGPDGIVHALINTSFF